MNAIVAADKNWAIGYKNKLLVSIPADMKFFRQMTGGKVVDTYFPNLDQLEDWEMTEVSEEHTCFDLEYVFSTYERRQ